MADINYTINNGVLPSWHDKYVENGTTAINLDKLLIPVNSAPDFGFKNSSNDIPYMAATESMKLSYSLPCFIGIDGHNYVLDGCAHFNQNNAKLSFSKYSNDKWVTIERKYNSDTSSYGIWCDSTSGINSGEWEISSKAPYITYLILSGAGGGGAGSSFAKSGGGGGGASVLQVLIDWTKTEKIRIYLPNGGDGGEKSSNGSNGLSSNLEIYTKDLSAPAVTFIIPGGRGGTFDGAGGSGGGIPQYTTHNNLTPQNVYIGLSLNGVYCIDYWQGAKGGAPGEDGDGKNTSEISMGPFGSIPATSYTGGTGNYGGGGGATAMGSGTDGSDYVNGSDGGGDGTGGGGAAFATILGGGTGGAGGRASAIHHRWATNN